MRIWLVNQYALPQAEVGHTRHFFLAKELIARGHEVTVISSNFNHFSGKYIDGVARKRSDLKTHDGVPFLWLPVPTYRGNSLGRIKNMFSFAKRLTEKKHFKQLLKPDVVIGSSPQPFAAFGAYRLAKKQRAKFVLEVRDLWPESLIDLGSLSNKHPIVLIVRNIINRLYKKSEKIITLLPNSMDYISSFGVARNKIVWAPNFVNIENLPEPKNNDSTKPFTIMYAGSHGIANGLECVVQAAKHLKEHGYENKIQFVLIGHGAEKLRLQAFVQKNELKNVEFRDVIPKTEILDVLNQADAFLMLLSDSPVFKYGISPNKLFDYFALGKPVISNIAQPFHPDDINDNMIHVPPNNASALATAAIELLNKNQTELDDMGAHSRAMVFNYFTVNKVADTIESTLTK